MPRPAGPQSGVTLTEMLIAVSILAILMSLALPSFQTMIANAKVRGTAESFITGLQLARGEAVRRNARVRFEMAAATAGWSVKLESDQSVIQERPTVEGSDSVTITKTPSGGTVVVFNSFGRGVDVAGVTEITQIDVSASGANSTRRLLIGADGSVRLCDPAVTSTSDPRKC